VDDIVVQARTPDGEDKSWDRNDAVDAPVMPGFMLYSDERGLFLNPPMQPTGSFVDVYTAKTTTSPHLFIFGHTFGGDIPVKSSKLSVSAPEGWVVEIAGEAMDAPKDIAPTSTSTENGVTTRVWQQNDLAAKKDIARGFDAGFQHDAVTVRLKSWTGTD